MGVHEANQEAGSDWSSPEKFYYRIHLKIELEDETEKENVLTLLRTGYESADIQARNDAWGDLALRMKAKVDKARNTANKPGKDRAKAIIDAACRDYGDVPTEGQA